MSDKIYISAQQLLEDSFRLGAQILKSEFRPTFIVAIWRGGAPIGIAVQEMLSFFAVETNHIAIRTSSYTAMPMGAPPRHNPSRKLGRKPLS